MIQVEGIFAGGDSAVSAMIVVAAPTGSTVTALLEDDNETLTATEDSGNWTFKVHKFGTWTITAIKGSDTATTTVVVDAETAYFISLYYGAKASITATDGVTYTNGISDLDADVISKFAVAISDNSDITNDTYVVYIDYGEINRKVSVGDQVTISLDGTDYIFDIIGFNHDTLTDTTAYGASTETGKAGMTLQMHDLFATTYRMNQANTNSGGWKDCNMRISTMVTMKHYLPDEWESIVKSVNKDSGVGGSSSEVETVSDNCFLLSEVELFGAASSSVSGEGNRYAYYAAGNSKIKKKSGAANSWWERSPVSGNSMYFCIVTSSGSAGQDNGGYNPGFSFAFCV